MQDALRGIQEKTTALTFNDLRRLLFRCAALLISKEGVRVASHSVGIGLNRTPVRLWTCILYRRPAFRRLYALGHLRWYRRLDMADRGEAGAGDHSDERDLRVLGHDH
jgi:hypothetical protein